MPSEPSLLAGTYARGPAAEQVGDAAWLQAMLEVEAALAEAAAAEGEIPAAAAEEIAVTCRQALGRLDLVGLRERSAANASPVVGLVAQLREMVSGAARPHVHPGATSQDIVDTALMLVARRALGGIDADAGGAAAAAARLAAAHRDTPMIARTLLQPAQPTTFGLRAAGWAVGLAEARAGLLEVAERDLAVQMGGPVGARGPAVAARVAGALHLAEPRLPWGAIRVRPARLAGALGVLSGVLAKIARDVTLLAQAEVGEVREGGDENRGGSSVMAHKRNPVAAVSVLACANRMPGLIADVLAGMEQEHERAAGAWQAEWGALRDLLGLAGSAAAWGRDLLEGLQVDPERMRDNLRAAPTGDQPVPSGARELVDRVLGAHLEDAVQR